MILTVNSGSSSIRLQLFDERGGGLTQVAQAHRPAGDVPGDVLLEEVLAAAPHPLSVVAHRVVHGGSRFSAACRIDEEVLTGIESLAALAPLHNPPTLDWIRRCARLLGNGVPQVAVFDTAFFADLPPVAARYALPLQEAERLGVRRYGFHGLAHGAMWRRWCALRPELKLGGRLIAFQLGAGCSAAAIAHGQARDTSMGFSPLEGLVMATRSGDVDPGALLHWQREAGLSPEAMERVLNRESGLLGLSGMSGDMRELTASPAPAAREAVALYAYRARKYLGAYLAVLGGTDGVVFGGGVGENAPAVREAILERMGWCGLILDPERNREAVGREARITAAESPVAAWVVPVDEGRVLAEEALEVLASVNSA